MEPIVKRFKEMAERRLIVRAVIYAEGPSFFLQCFAGTICEDCYVEMELEYQPSRAHALSPRTFFTNASFAYWIGEEKIENALQNRLRGTPYEHQMAQDVLVSMSATGSLERASTADWRFLQGLAVACKHIADEITPELSDQKTEKALGNLLARMSGLLHLKNEEFLRAVRLLVSSS